MIFTCFIYHPQGLTEERKGKAVYEISAEKGMKLTKAALENIEVKTVKITEGFEASVPLSSLVQFQDQLGVYRVREDWFKLIKVEVIKKNYQSAQIHGDFLPGDSLVIEGASLLRISELDAFWSIEKL
jgi:hypothetical protein